MVAPSTAIPTGTVTLRIDGNIVATTALNSAGQFSFTATAPLGTHQVTVTFDGNASFATSVAPIVVLDVGPEVPTLSEWMLLLALALAAAAVYASAPPAQVV